MSSRTRSSSDVRFIPLSYNNNDSQSSALRLILTLLPEWEHGKIEFVRFTDGITNTLLKAVNKSPGLSQEQIDAEAILLRAYGKGTDVIIDRERETQNHELLMKYNLAPALLARFQNGMLYRFISGSVTSPKDLRRESISLGIARRLGEWHAVVPCLQSTRQPLAAEIEGSEEDGIPAPTSSKMDPASQKSIDTVAPGKPAPNTWTVMQKWIYALPTSTEAQRERQATLQRELLRLVAEMANRPGLGENSLVFAHTDLLSGNVIVNPTSKSSSSSGAVNGSKEIASVHFIDYEYATPSPAAFDIANHFAEWGGFECDFSKLPTKTQRLTFIREYISSYNAHISAKKGANSGSEMLRKHWTREQEELETWKLFDEVDVFRGVPGFYWGVWALIQDTISQIDFDYAAYAEIRLGEYWAWREEVDGTREKEGREIGAREKRWAEE